MALFVACLEQIVRNASGAVTAGTKLYRRDAPPRGDAIAYAANESKEFLGYVLIKVGVPRWMSTHFADVMAEQDLPEADLNIYTQDWMEKILYVPADILPEDAPQGQMLDFANSVIQISDDAQHQLSCGCDGMAPRTTIHAFPNSARAVDTNPYYAISKARQDDPAHIDEITITTVRNRAKFAASPMHRFRLKQLLELRELNPDLRNLIRRRNQVLNAILAGLPEQFQA